MAVAANLYETDFYAWTIKQADLIKHHSLANLDLVHLQEELQIMGATERRELSNRLTILIMHLLKWKYQSAKQCKRWELIIKEQRLEVADHLRINPSLKSKADEYIAAAYKKATLKAAIETKLSEKSFPTKCLWSIKQILDKNFYPA